MELLNKWIEYLSKNSQTYKLNSAKLTEIKKSFIHWFGKDYFQIPKSENQKYPRYQHESWLRFLLSNHNVPYTFSALEIYAVIKYLNNKGLEDYVTSKLKKNDGSIHPKLFEGNYHELYTCYVFLRNGIDYKPEYNLNGIPYDGYVESNQNKKIIIECREVTSKEYILKLFNTNIKLMACLEEFAKKSLGLNKPLICGYYLPNDKFHQIEKSFKSHLHDFRKHQITGAKFYTKDYINGRICVDEFQEGIYEHYQSENNQPMVKFKTTLEGVQHVMTFARDEVAYINRIINKGINKKKRQHKNILALKILCITITNYAFGEPFRLDRIDRFRTKIQNRLNNNTAVLLLIRDLLNTQTYKVHKWAIATEENEELEKQLMNYNLNIEI